MEALAMVAIERSSDLAMVGANGGGWVAPVGTAQPTDATTAPIAPYEPLGAISDSGLVYGFAESNTQFTPWGEASPWRTIVTSSVRTFQIELWETNRAAVRSVMFRVAETDLTPDTTSHIVSFAESGVVAPDPRSWVFDIYDGANLERFYVPNGEITDRTDVTYKQDTMAGYQITVTAYPDDSGNTVYHQYLDAALDS
jgi:hypothetical protein